MVSSSPHPTFLMAAERASIRTLRFAGDERALLDGIAAGQGAAVAELYDRYAADIRRWLLRLVGPTRDLDELVQATYAAAFESIGRLRAPSALRAWMVSLAIERARRYLRAKRCRRWFLLRRRNGGLGKVGAAMAPSRSSRLAPAEAWRVLDRMGVEDRIVFSLRFIEGMDPADMVVTLDQCRSTIARRLVRASARFEGASRRTPILQAWQPGSAAPTGSEGKLEQVGAALAQELEQYEAIAQEQDAFTRQRVLRRYLERRGRRQPRAWLVGLAGAVAALLVLHWLREGRQGNRFLEPITSTALPEENYLLSFSDGSTLQVAERYGARVLKTSAGGAEIALEHGKVEAHVVRRGDGDWKVLAGPFTVQSEGARFTADWQPEAGRLLVDVSEGRVSIRRAADPQHQLQAGERIELTVAPNPWEAISLADESTDSGEGSLGSVAAAADR